MQDDVWTGTDTPPPDGVEGERVPVNQAFSFDRVLRYGQAFAKEQPLFTFGAGFILLLCQFGPVVAAYSFTILAKAVGEGEDGGLAQLGANILQLGLSLVAAPVQVLVTAGIARSIAGYAQGEAVAWSALYTHLLPAVRGFVYQLVVGLLTALLALMFIVPGVLAIAAAVYAAFGAAGPIEVDLGGMGLALGALGVLILLVGLAVVVYVMLGFALGYNAAVLDDLWPHEALAVSWKAAKGNRLTLLVTQVVIGMTVTIALVTVYCAVGLVLFPMVLVAWQAGMVLAWLLHARHPSTTRAWPFFERHGGA